jgi:hypothetical protein
MVASAVFSGLHAMSFLGEGSGNLKFRFMTICFGANTDVSERGVSEQSMSKEAVPPPL